MDGAPSVRYTSLVIIKMIKLLVCIILTPSVALAGGFFEREVAEERGQWLPVSPEEFFLTVFPDEGVVTENRFRIEINIPERRLYVYQGGQVIRTHQVAVGSARYRTPVGPRYLSSITWNPWWFPPPAEWAKNEKPTPPGPGNPLGRVKMSLGGDILLHGTNKEGSVGRPVSHGCMRMKNREAEDLAWFFQNLFSDQKDDTLRETYRENPRVSFSVKLNQPIPVTILYDRVAVREKELEIYPDIYGRERNIWGEVMEELSVIGISPWEIDPARLEEEREDGIGVTVSIRELVTPS